MADSLMHTACLLCGKHAVSVPWHLEGLPYENYSYCSDCISKGIELLKAHEQTSGEWVSVKDRLPKEDTIVLVACKYVEPGQKERLYVETAERIGFDWVSQTDEYKLHRQFHTQPYAWMPLPEPPKEG